MYTKEVSTILILNQKALYEDMSFSSMSVNAMIHAVPSAKYFIVEVVGVAVTMFDMTINSQPYTYCNIVSSTQRLQKLTTGFSNDGMSNANNNNPASTRPVKSASKFTNQSEAFVARFNVLNVNDETDEYII